MSKIHNEDEQQSPQLQASNVQDLQSSLQEHQHQQHLQLASSPHNLPSPSSSSYATPSMSTLQNIETQHQQYLQLASSPHNLPGPPLTSSAAPSMSALQNIETANIPEFASSPHKLSGSSSISFTTPCMSTLQNIETVNIPELASNPHNLPSPSSSSYAIPSMSTLQNIVTQHQQQLQPASSPHNLPGPSSSSSATPSMSTLENIETANIPELASSSHNLPGPSSGSFVIPSMGTLQNIETQHQPHLQLASSLQNLPGPPSSSSATSLMSTLQNIETANIPKLASNTHNLSGPSSSSSATPSMSTLQNIETQHLQLASSPQNLPVPPSSSSATSSMSTVQNIETDNIPELASSPHNLSGPSSSSSATPSMSTLQNMETQHQQQLQPTSSPHNLPGPPSSSSASPSMSSLQNIETANIPEHASSSHNLLGLSSSTSSTPSMSILHNIETANIPALASSPQNLPDPSSSSSITPSMSTLQNIETQDQQQLQPTSSPQNLPGPPSSSCATPSMSSLQNIETANIPELASSSHNLPGPSSSSSATPSMSTLQNIETANIPALASSPHNLQGPSPSSSATPSMSTLQNIETQHQQQLQPTNSPHNLPGPPSSSSATPSMSSLQNIETANIPELSSSSHNLPGPSSSSSATPSMSTLQNIETTNIPALASSPHNLPGPTSSSSATPSMSTLQNIETANISVKLTSKNYHIWKSLVLPELRKYNLGGIIDGTEPCPPQYLTNDEGRLTETLNPTYSSWIDRDRQLLMWLKSTLSEGLLPHRATVSNSRDLWIELEKRFKVTPDSHILQLLKKDNSMDITTYLQIAKRYADELADVGAPVALRDLVDHILQGLPKQYNTFTTSIRTRMNLHEVTVEELGDLLLSEEKRIRALATLSSYANCNNILPIKDIREIMISSLLDLLSYAEVAISNPNTKDYFGKNDMATEIERLRKNLIDIRQAFIECSEESVNALFKKLLQPQHTLHHLLLRPGQTKIHDLPAKQFQLRIRLLNQMVIKLKEMIPLLQKSSSSQARTECSKLSYELPHLHFSKVFQDSQAFKDFRVVYDRLDVPKKLCLLCFAAIPANEVIKKRLLVHWWVGEGFVNPSVDDEDVIFEELTKKGCIEPVKKKQRSDVHGFKMHPIIRSAVIFIAEEAGFLDFDDKENPTINFSWSYRACLVNGSSHLNKIFMSTSDLYRENELRPDLDPRKLQTIFNVNESYPDFSRVDWSKLRNLKVLYLGRWHSKATHHIEIDDNDFLNGLGFMRQLIVLSLRGISKIVKLPDSVCKLVSLRILDLSACHNLDVLPEKIGSLKKLTYLDMSECYLLEHMPKGIASLRELQVLKGFIIGHDKNDTLCTLQDLLDLKKLGKLTINTSRKDFPTEEELNVFQQFGLLRNLTILWEWLDAKPSKSSNLNGNADNKKQHNDAANPVAGSGTKATSSLNQENQEPFMELEKLDLQGYPLKIAPSWLRPAQLKSLKKLYIRGGQLQSLSQRDDHSYENDKWKVKILRLKFLSELGMDWNDLLVSFPDLIYIEKFRCPKLTFFPCNESGVWLKPEN